MTTHHDVVVIGGGIAGASVAYHLADSTDVALLDMEDTLGYHSTSRSAAMYLETYGGQDVRALTAASRSFLEQPTIEFESALLRPRALMQIARTGQDHLIDELYREVEGAVSGAHKLSPAQVHELCPIVRRESIAGGLYESTAMEIDVDALHQGYVRGFRHRNGVVHRKNRVMRIERRKADWLVEVSDGSQYTASTVVNAAGAWADQVANLAGIDQLGLVPRRRTAFITGPPDVEAVDTLPMVYDVEESFYIKPEGSEMLCSPADTTPCQPEDAKPDEMEIARSLESIREFTTVPARSVRSAWAGLRTFSSDGNLVIGQDPADDQFVWLAAQGGYGVQTAPAASRFAASLIQHLDTPTDIVDAGLEPHRLSPSRFG